MAAMQTVAAADRASTPEGALLEMFSLPGNVTGTGAARTTDAINADAAARQLATGDIGPDPSGGAAAIVASQRSAPPPGPR
jgi:hypothetical protein